MKSIAIGQAVLGMLTLLGCLLAPRPGAAVLLVPLGAREGAQSALTTLSNQVSLIGTGRSAGSLLVYPKRSLAIVPLLRNGVLPIAVPSFLCSPALPAS